VQGLGRVAILVATADASIEVRADERVREIAAAFPQLNIFVFGGAEAGSLFRRLEQLELGAMTEAFAIKSYGAVRNLGLAVASVLGSDAVVFIDDDEIIDQGDFIRRAMFGIGHPIHSGGYLFAKSGLVTDAQGDYFQSGDKHWADMFWHQSEAFNKTIQIALRPPQMHRAPFAYGGCLAIHREMYTKIAFDPWIMRGEDVDYVINARLHGGDVFVDDQWTIRHNSPSSGSGAAARFRQNVYRFIYEHRKLEFAKSQVDLAQVTAHSLMPFPGLFLASSVGLRAFATGLLHTLSGPERGHYWRTAFEALGRANRHARENCVNYFALQRMWGHTMSKLWRDVALHTLFTGERSVDRTALTGSFKAIR
jgi:GT2 family glycosyltransferase